jgi:hypothetical protein
MAYRCYVCNGPLSGDPLAGHNRWTEVCCGRHARDGTPRCRVCGYIAAADDVLYQRGTVTDAEDAMVQVDAAWECGPCSSRDVVLAQSDAVEFLREVCGLSFHADVGISFEFVSPRRMAADVDPEGRGETLGYCRYHPRQRSCAVFVNSVQTEAGMACTCAHELFHAWIRSSGHAAAFGGSSEAACELVALALALHLDDDREIRAKKATLRSAGRAHADRARRLIRAYATRSVLADAADGAFATAFGR